MKRLLLAVLLLCSACSGDDDGGLTVEKTDTGVVIDTSVDAVDDAVDVALSCTVPSATDLRVTIGTRTERATCDGTVHTYSAQVTAGKVPVRVATEDGSKADISYTVKVTP